ncbi:uncharacterized protein LOC117287754 isoform X1 [Asterias rubens]|uniref:uncharacterized protein LOC117287754 isoform X1 n=1 Tax=Asterias rubens TaxID=7604 RepID=UPI00145585B8|nr:uncharacterized protein LOC117287754 isoform X1 [Asterias rubens]
MSLKWFLLVLLAFVVLDERVVADPPCQENPYTQKCLGTIVSRSKKNSLQNEEPIDPMTDPAWFEHLLKPAVEPTCKLRDIFNLLSNDCRSELIQILNLLLTNPDY